MRWRLIRAELPDAPIEVLPGKSVCEIKHSGFTKATGVLELMTHAPFKGRRPMFIGDDVTDETVFAIMPELRGSGILGRPSRRRRGRTFRRTARCRGMAGALAARNQDEFEFPSGTLAERTNYTASPRKSRVKAVAAPHFFNHSPDWRPTRALMRREVPGTILMNDCLTSEHRTLGT